MKRVIILVIVNLLWAVSTASADVYVKVDAQGNAIGGAIVCEANVCGDSQSDYAKATLGPGESYALQGTGSTGIGINSTGTTLKVDLKTNDWTVTTSTIVELPEPIKVADREITAVTTQTTQRFNPVQPVTSTPVTQTPAKVLITETATATTETATAVIDTNTSKSILDEEIDYTWDWDKIWLWIIAYLDQYWGKP